MKENKNKELQSRRDFFKKAAKSALPIIGAIALAGAPGIVKAASEEATSCQFGCSYSCSGSCGGACSYSCQNTCSGGCQGRCTMVCASGCSGSCQGRCSGSCRSMNSY